MRLLILTQVMDTKHPVLGFMNVWASAFAKHFERITIVCLEKGSIAVPHNVHVYSLGKEDGRSRIKYLFNFYRHIFRERYDYDVVLVHMNQEYVLLGGWLWKLLGKPVYLWRNHYAGSWLTDVAARFCEKVFCTSRVSYTAKYEKTVLMPVGVDVDFFQPVSGVVRGAHSVLFLARIAPAKRPHLLVEALALLQKKGVPFTAHLYGGSTPQDTSYLEGVKKRISELGLEREVLLPGPSPYIEGPKIYSAHEIFVNLSPSGMYDKTLFESAGCETLVLASSLDFAKLVDTRFTFQEDNVESLAKQLEGLLRLSSGEKQRLGKEMRALAVENHSLAVLGKKLKEELIS